MVLNFSYRKIAVVYSSLLAWLPLLNIGRFLPGISISEFLLMIFTSIALLIQHKQKTKYAIYEQVFALFAFYCLLQTSFAFLLNESFELHWLNRVVRFLFYCLCILLTSKKFFIEETFFKSFNIFAVFLFVGIIFQYIVFYSSGTYIRLYEYILPIDENSLRLLTDYERIFSYGAFRPSSFLLEPSHIAQYLIIVLIYDIFAKQYGESGKIGRIDFFMITIICTAILLSKSLWGYFLLFLIIGFYTLVNIKKKHKGYWLFIAPVIAIVGLLILIYSNLLTDTFSRINLFDLGSSTSFTGRFGKYEFVDTENIVNLIFGNGFGAGLSDLRAYPNSILFILVGEGIVGICLIAILYVTIMFNVQTSWKRLLCSVFYMLLFGSTIFFSTGLILVLSCLFNKIILRTNASEL